MWLEVGPTNNYPSVIAHYFVDCVQQIGGTPRVIRADDETEYCNVLALQRFFRRNGNDAMAEKNVFFYRQVNYESTYSSLVGYSAKRLRRLVDPLFSRTRGTVIFTVVTTWCKQNVPNFVLCL